MSGRFMKRSWADKAGRAEKPETRHCLFAFRDGMPYNDRNRREDVPAPAQKQRAEAAGKEVL